MRLGLTKRPGMTVNSKSLSTAGILLSWAAAFHVAAFLVGRIDFSTILLVIIGAACFKIAWSFLQGSTFWTNTTVMLMIAGAASAHLMTKMDVAAPIWCLVPIMWLEIAVALSLLVHIARR
jgi:hypothetical protein